MRSPHGSSFPALPGVEVLRDRPRAGRQHHRAWRRRGWAAACCSAATSTPSRPVTPLPGPVRRSRRAWRKAACTGARLRHEGRPGAAMMTAKLLADSAPRCAANGAHLHQRRDRRHLGHAARAGQRARARGDAMISADASPRVVRFGEKGHCGWVEARPRQPAHVPGRQRHRAPDGRAGRVEGHGGHAAIPADVMAAMREHSRLSNRSPARASSTWRA
jgi:hypothetical protein